MFSLHLNSRLYYHFDVFYPGSVLYVIRTNVKEIDDAVSFKKVIINFLVELCILYRLQYIVLHNELSPFSLEESQLIEREVLQQIQSRAVAPT